MHVFPNAGYELIRRFYYPHPTLLGTGPNMVSSRCDALRGSAILFYAFSMWVGRHLRPQHQGALIKRDEPPPLSRMILKFAIIFANREETTIHTRSRGATPFLKQHRQRKQDTTHVLVQYLFALFATGSLIGDRPTMEPGLSNNHLSLTWSDELLPRRNTPPRVEWRS
ncbi:hypothetical protein PIB30_052828 [Stylosanthes scabra]|uniref:Uncharacterized protein n=1 Tax=Stylosanthes scabra TaxID=79078 RepID=A0ABU6ZH56_9FABA|nr:hypothetical protein [Stylosanthes scabra]